MIKGIIIGILVWQTVILILALADKLYTDAGTLFASGIFGLVTIGIQTVYRTVRRRLARHNLNKHYVKVTFMNEKNPIQAFFVPIKEVDHFCNDDTRKYYVKVAPANVKNHIDEMYILTLSKVQTGFAWWTSDFLKKFLR